MPIDGLVPGDIVFLSAGDMVPADMRLLHAKDLFVNQAALTGESMPVEKFANADAEAKTALDARCLCFMGSNVVSGSAIGVIAATGAGTYFGALAGSLVGQRVETSFDKGIKRFAWLMLRFMAGDGAGGVPDQLDHQGQTASRLSCSRSRWRWDSLPKCCR